MYFKKLLLIGIDPGMTTAYALLDTSGKFILSRSAKQLDLSQLLSEIHAEGKVLAVGTDKAKVPGLILEFAAKSGAKVFHPKEDLKVLEKKGSTGIFQTSNTHEMDALASALFAYHELKPLLLKIQRFCDEEKRTHQQEKIIELVVKKGMSIRGAIDILDTKPQMREIQEKKMPTLAPDILQRKQHSIDDLKNQLSLLKGHLHRLQIELSKKEQPRLIVKKEAHKDLANKDSTIMHLRQSLIKKEAEKARWQRQAQHLESFLLKSKDHYVLKILENLGSEEYKRKRFLSIEKNDILLVNDANSMSMQVIDDLREKVSIIVHKKPLSERVRTMLPFIFLDATKLHLKESGNFALAPKKELDELKSAKRALHRIVEDYKKERERIIL